MNPIGVEEQALRATDALSPEEGMLLNAALALSGRIRLILVVSVFTFVVSLGAFAFVPSQYQAQTTLLLGTSGNSPLGTLAAQYASLPAAQALLGGTGLDAGTARSIEGTYVTILSDDVTRLKLAEELGEHAVSRADSADLLARMARQLKFEADARRNTFTISFTDRSPVVAARAANFAVTILTTQLADLADSDARQRLNVILRQAVLARHAAQAAADSLTSQSKGKAVSSFVDVAASDAEGIRNRLAEIRESLARMAPIFGPDHPSVRRLREDQSSLARMLSEAEYRGAIVNREQRPYSDEYRDQVNRIRFLESTAQALTGQAIATELEAQRSFAVVRVIEPARPPLVRNYPRPLRSAAIVSLLVFALVSVVVLVSAAVSGLATAESTSGIVRQIRLNLSRTIRERPSDGGITP